MAAMPFLCNSTLLFQGNLPMVLPVIICKYASCFIPYIISFVMGSVTPKQFGDSTMSQSYYLSKM